MAGDDDGFLEENEGELKGLAEAIGESDAGKIAGAAAALATKVLTGSSIAAGGVEKAIAQTFGRWFADHPDARMDALAKEFQREEQQRDALAKFAMVVRPVLEDVQGATTDQLKALLDGHARTRQETAQASETLEALLGQALEQLARVRGDQAEVKAALERVTHQRSLTQAVEATRSTGQPLHLRFFVSSPGDVCEERRIAIGLIEKLAKRPAFKGALTIEVIAWDAPHASVPMDATRTPQDAVNDYAGLPSDCDLTLVFLWSRLGTPLPRDKRRADGSTYESGTVWELEEAEQASKEIWIYRRNEKPRVELDDPALAEKQRAYQAVKDFFAKFNDADGSIRRGYHRYETLDAFEPMLGEHLEHFVAQRLRQFVPAQCDTALAAIASSSAWRWPLAYDFAGFVAEKKAGFVGRKALFEKVEAWHRDPNGARALLVLADFGVGKSAFAAELMARRSLPVVAYHFCHADEELTLEPANFVGSIAAQLAESLPGYRAYVENEPALQKMLDEVARDPGATFSQAVIAPLWKQLPVTPEPVVLLIDALDEFLESRGEDKVRASIVSLLAQHAARMPPWLRVLATSRNRVQVTEPLRLAFQPDTIDAESEANLEDLRVFVLARCQEPALAARLHAARREPIALANAIVRKSGGKFLYAVRVLPEFTWDRKRRSLEDLDSLPAGMDTFYMQAFTRRFPDRVRYRDRVAPVLGLLFAQRAPMPHSEFADAVGRAVRDVAEVLHHLRDFLRGSREKGFAFDHVSLAQWLTEEDTDTGLARSGDFEIEKATAEVQLRTWALRRLELRTAHESSYLAEHLPAHLPADELPKAYRTALLDVRWLRARVNAVGVNGLLRDLERSRVQHDEVLRLLGDAIRLSSHVLARHPGELPGQLLGRLTASDQTELATLAESARKELPLPAFVPSAACLGHPGGPLIRTFEGHTGYVRSVAFSPDGARTLSGSGDYTLKLWDTASGTLLQTFEGHTDEVTSVAFSSEGARALSGSDDNTLKLWDIASGTLLQTFEGHTSQVTSVAFSPDGARALSGSGDYTVKLWETASGTLLQTLEGHTSQVTSVAFSSDGARALSGSWDHTVKLWDTASGTLLQTFEGHADWVTSVAISSDDARALSGSWDHTVKLWDTASGTLLQTFEGHTDKVTSVAFSRDGACALSGSWDHAVKLWDTASGTLLQTFEGHTSQVTSVVFSPGDGRALSGSDDNTLKLWDTASGVLLQTFEGHTDKVTSVAFSPDGARALSGSEDHTVKLWDTTSRTVLQTFEGHTSLVTSVAFSPDGARALSGSWDHTLKLWELQTSGTLFQTFEGHTSGVTSAAFSPDGARALSGSEDGTLLLWDTASGTLLQAFEGHPRWVTEVAFSPDGARVLSGSYDNTLKLWDIASGTLLQTFEGHTGRVTISVAFSPDGARALSGSDDNTVKLWDIASGTLLQTFEGHTDKVTSVAFSPDGARVLSGSRDHSLKLWGARQGRLLATFTLDAAIRAIALSPDGLWCLAGTDEGRVCFFEIRG